jgi:hypothetical protein
MRSGSELHGEEAARKLARSRLDELVLYVCSRVERPADLGAVKLQKVFWFSDCALFVRRKKPLTGVTYVKAPYGPYSPQIEKSIQRLLKSNRLAEKKFGGQRQFFATERAAQLDATIEQIVNNHSAASISEASHDRIWELAELGEDLPLSGVFAAQLAEPNIDDLKWARKSVTPELLAWSEQELRKDS